MMHTTEQTKMTETKPQSGTETVSTPPKNLVQSEDWADFCEWARDGGYDQSYFNRWDSKSIELQKQYLAEREEAEEQS